MTTADDDWVGVVSAHLALRADPTPLERQSVGEYGEALARTVDHFLPRRGRVEVVEAMADALRGGRRSDAVAGDCALASDPGRKGRKLRPRIDRHEKARTRRA